MSDGENHEQIIPHNKRRLQRTRTRRKLFRKKRQETFLEHLAATCNVTASAEAAGVVPGTVYAQRMKNPAFREAWAAALEQGYARLETALLERALKGADAPKVRGDKDPSAGSGQGDALDAMAAMQLLREHKRGLAGIAKPTRTPAPARIEDASKELIRKLRALGVKASK